MQEEAKIFLMSSNCTKLGKFHLLQADDLLLQLCLCHIQRACSNFAAASEEFLQPTLLSLIGLHSVSENTRFQVCCLLTVFLAAASPTQEAKVQYFSELHLQKILTLANPESTFKNDWRAVKNLCKHRKIEKLSLCLNFYA